MNNLSRSAYFFVSTAVIHVIARRLQVSILGVASCDYAASEVCNKCFWYHIFIRRKQQNAL